MGTKNTGPGFIELAGHHHGGGKTDPAASANSRAGIRPRAMGRNCPETRALRAADVRRINGRATRWLGLGAAFLLIWPAQGLSAPPAEKPKLTERLGPETVMPRADQLRPWVRSSGENDNRNQIAPEDMVRDPKKMIEFLKGRPDRMDVNRMDPALTLTISGVLIEGGAWLTAEKLLFDASALWPERADVRTTHARVLIQLGRPSAALRTISEATKLMPDLSTPHFLKALALLRAQPVTQAKRIEAMGELETVLKLDPDFRDPSGWTATDVRSQLRQMRSGRRADP